MKSLQQRARSTVLGASLCCAAFVVVTATASPCQCPRPQESTLIPHEVVAVYPHDPNAYTQGLYFEDGFLFEGTGIRGRSYLRQVELQTGKVLRQISLPSRFFGEGIASFGDRLYQLTWTSRLGFIYDKESFELLRQFSYATDGWGLTRDDRFLIMSDGSPVLQFLDPDSLEVVRRIQVAGPSGPINQLNELEYIRGNIYANVWHTNRIVRISPETGEVLGHIDLSELILEVRPSDPEAVLNGIAYDEQTERIFVTGKLWPKLFEIRLPESR